jgi:zinc protease
MKDHTLRARKSTAWALALIVGVGTAGATTAQQEQPPPPGAPHSPKLPTPAELYLKNGLRVIVIERQNVPLVSAELLIKSGGAADPAGLAGLASMTADLLTKGTKTRTAPVIASTIEALGGSISSSGGWDSASVSVDVMSDKLAPAMEVMADTARNPAFQDEEIERLRQQDIDGLNVSLHDPGNLAPVVANRVVFGDAPYGHALGGTPESIAAIKRPDIVALHGTYYRPDNAVLVVGGDVKTAEVFKMAERLFGDWARPATPLIKQTKSIGDINNTQRVVVIDMPDAGQAAVVTAERGIDRADPDFFKGLVANTVLGGGYSSRLNFEIRIKRGLSYGAGSGLAARRDVGPFSASAQTKNESGAVVAGLMIAELTRLSTEPAVEKELTARKATLIGEFSRDFETTGGLVGEVANRALFGLSLNEINIYIARVQAVSAAEVQGFAATHFNPKTADIIIVGDASKFLDELRKQYPNVEVIPFASLDLNTVSLRKAPISAVSK